MIGGLFKYLITPGLFHASPKDVNPVQSAINISKQHLETKSKLKEQGKEDLTKRFEDVNEQRAARIFEDEIKRLGVSEEKVTTRYHQHLMQGALFIVLGGIAVALPILGLFVALNVSIPIISYFLPTFTYPVLITMIPTSGLLLLLGLRHWYMAKMIVLRQRFSFPQYIRSFCWLPNRSRVVK